MDKNKSALFFTCSLIEFIGRTTKNKMQEREKMEKITKN